MMMKRLLLLSLVLFLPGLSVVPGSLVAGERSVTILYTGGLKGNVEPCAA